MSLFDRFALFVTELSAHSMAFGFALGVVASSLVTSWSVTDGIMTAVGFLMLFVIQNTQSRNNKAQQTKLDALILVTPEARNTLIDLENKSEAEILAEKEQLRVKSNVQRRSVKRTRS
jgi:low affinity Fe/Cu permease